MSKLTEMIEKHEGRKHFIYDDATGKEIDWDKVRELGLIKGHATVGVGRNVESVLFSDDEIDKMLFNDILFAKGMLRDIFPNIDNLSEARCSVLTEMMFNLGYGSFCGFKNMIKTINDKDFKKASEEMLNSKWASQVGKRAEELAKIMEQGYY